MQHPQFNQTSLKILNKYALYKTDKILEFSCTNLLGDPLPTLGQTFLDIGGGHGIFTLYAGLLGANAVLLEPELDGSSKGMISTFQQANQELGLTNYVTTISMTFQEFAVSPDWSQKRWDIVLLSNSINHLDEDATIQLQRSRESRERVFANLSSLHNILNPGGRLIITDCMRRNLWADLGMTSPFAPSIEWHKHQDPKIWVSLLKQAGFSSFKIQWSKFQRFRFAGLPIFSNRLVAWMTDSHFRIECSRKI